MSKILVINSSAAGADSVSRELVAETVAQLREVNPAAMFTYRDVGANPPPHLVAQKLNGVRGTPATDI
jgi:FMN-dependent NADH-azoreductase